MTPLPVRAQAERDPRDRPQNVPMVVTPFAIESFDYYPWSFAVGLLARWLSSWGFPWWLADSMTGYGAGAYGAGSYGEAAGVGDYGALRYGMGKFGTGGYA